MRIELNEKKQILQELHRTYTLILKLEDQIEDLIARLEESEG